MNILRKVAEAICEYGKWGAGLLSNHGVFEEDVPEELVKAIKE